MQLHAAHAHAAWKRQQHRMQQQGDAHVAADRGSRGGGARQRRALHHGAPRSRSAGAPPCLMHAVHITPRTPSRRIECIYVDREKKNGTSTPVGVSAHWHQQRWRRQLRGRRQRLADGGCDRRAVNRRQWCSTAVEATSSSGSSSYAAGSTDQRALTRLAYTECLDTNLRRLLVSASRCGGACCTAGSTQERSTGPCCCSQRWVAAIKRCCRSATCAQPRSSGTRRRLSMDRRLRVE